ncbi:MAG TPA: hypothetical protein VGM84_15340 [Steroidobacteraceae bacterium]|jgi:hypothetical protein
MAKHALVFIHGMGEQTQGWHQPALDVLSKAFPTYELLKNRSLTDFVEPVPILYSDFFTQLRNTWKTDVGQIKLALGQELQAADVPQRDAINNRFDSIANTIGAGTDSFVWTHAMDVVLYRFFSLTRQRVNVSVGKQIVAAAGPEFRGWSVIAHSLGTAVIHNTLNALYSTALIPGQPPLKPQETRPKVLAMVANVSRVLQLPAVKVFSSLVMPGDATQGRACDTYLNVRHVFDPFMFPQPFEPDNTWPTPGTFVPSQYQHIRPSNIDIQKLTDVHDLENYLENPRVHVPIFRGIVGPDVIPDGEFQEKCTAFDKKIAAAELNAIREALEQLIPAKTAEWSQILQTIFALSGLKLP